jgi:hypothetical protein
MDARRVLAHSDRALAYAGKYLVGNAMGSILNEWASGSSGTIHLAQTVNREL